MIKNIIRQFIPETLFNTLKKYYYNVKLRKARAAFIDSVSEPAWLDQSVLEKLHLEYKSDTHVNYDPDSLLHRGKERYEEIKMLLGDDFSKLKNCLEVGCGDGMVCSVFAEKGIQATALDYDDSMYDDRAKQNGVNFMVADASSIPLADESFDLVFSYNSFEHIMMPEKAFSECLRLLKPGGYLYITFNPMFLAPMGFHAYKSTQVPFIQVMFNDQTIKDFIESNSLPDITFSFSALNKWSVSDYRKMWDRFSNRMVIKKYNEIPDYYGIDLISRFPSCFKSKSSQLDDFIISGIALLAMKK